MNPTSALNPQERVDAWLADFEAALAVRDIDRVVAKFAVDAFWRDLVSFTWNLKTLEGREQIADMLGARLAQTGPSGFRTREAPDLQRDPRARQGLLRTSGSGGLRTRLG
jgi:putative flavoprotein involved in K+ transport